jgi:hypothetical protein
MKTYRNYKKELTSEELKKIRWTKFKIIVPTKKDKKDIIEALKHFHDSDIDTDFIPVNQLAHEYLNGSNVVVDPIMYKSIEEQEAESRRNKLKDIVKKNGKH